MVFLLVSMRVLIFLVVAYGCWCWCRWGVCVGCWYCLLALLLVLLIVIGGGDGGGVIVAVRERA